MISLDFSNLPKIRRGGISWQNSIGCIVPFVYNDITGVISIDAYDKNMLTITYDGFQSTVSPTKFRTGAVLKRIVEKKEARHLIVGVNDFNTKFPHLVKYLANSIDGKNVIWGSNQKVKCKCPICNLEKQTRFTELRRRGFSCNQCGDGFSYPSKVMTALLEQIGIEYIREYTPNWSNGKKYDHYIPSLSLIIEEHGAQHYKDVWGKYEEQHTIDLQKEYIAKKNGITHYIQLDCRESNINFIRNSINQSKILSLFHINDINIDWQKIDIFASQTSIFKLVCDEWNSQNNTTTTSLIAKKLNISTETVVRYLKRGNELSLVCYDPQKEKEKSNRCRAKSVTQYSLDGIKIATYASIAEASNIIGIPTANIRTTCNNHGTSGGFMWRYEDFDSIVAFEDKRGGYRLNIKAVTQYSLDDKKIATYESITEASKKVHISIQSICRVCNGKRKTAGGFIWKYADESELIA